MTFTQEEVDHYFRALQHAETNHGESFLDAKTIGELCRNSESFMNFCRIRQLSPLECSILVADILTGMRLILFTQERQKARANP